MTYWLDLVWMFAIVALTTWVFANAVVAVVTPFLRGQNLARERLRLWGIVALPWLLPLLSVLSLAGLSLVKYWGWIEDHCLGHQQHHPHFCFEHIPEILLGVSQSVIGLLIAGAVFITFALQLVTQIKQHAKAGLLQRLVTGERLLRQLNDRRPLAFIAGLRKPTMFFSFGLKSLLNKRQQRIVAAHEAAHIRSKDVLKNTIFELLLSLHICRSALRNAWHLNTEGLADQAVARRFNHLEVAEVLLKLERAAVANPYPLSIAGSNFQSRIRRLLQPELAERSVSLDLFIVVLMVAVPLALAYHHHTVETLLGWWLGK